MITEATSAARQSADDGWLTDLAHGERGPEGKLSTQWTAARGEPPFPHNTFHNRVTHGYLQSLRGIKKGVFWRLPKVS